MKSFERLLKFMASLKLAVTVILLLAVISAVGTVYEARYDAEVAQKLVYHSIYMYFALLLLCVNLIGVMVDRWPWKQHHAGFVLAHIGIIILLIGSWLTQRYGIDGSMAFQIGQEKRHVTVRERDLLVFASFDGSEMQNIHAGEIDFLRNPPSPERPFYVQLGQDRLEFTEYHHFAFREAEIMPSEDGRDGPAIRFQLENPNVNMTEWLRRERRQASAELDLGPAKIVLTNVDPIPSGRNEIVLRPGKDGQLSYTIFDKDGQTRGAGVLSEASVMTTPWMGLKFRLLRYLPSAVEKVRYTPSEGASPLAMSAAKFRFRDKEYWVGLNAVLRLYLEDRVYLISYGNRQLELQFPVLLKRFTMGKYQGTERAASYESLVEVPGRGEVLISMNEPLYHEGFTFYQASFEKNEQGEAVISVLSVNHDPGRWVKYLGSLLIVLGSIVLFYFKRVQWFGKGKST
jgi:hypothetical protein